METKELLEYVGSKIKELRLDNNLSQEELGNKLNLSKQAISNYEAGRRDPGQDNLFSLAEIFRVSIDYFFPSTGPTTPLQEYDPDAVEILELLDRPDMHDLKMLFMKTGNLSQEDKEQIVRILKATLPLDNDC